MFPNQKVDYLIIQASEEMMQEPTKNEVDEPAQVTEEPPGMFMFLLMKSYL